MRTAFSVFLSGLMLLILGCRHAGESNNDRGSAAGTDVSPSGQPEQPPSLVYFTDAEEKLAIREYHFAATQLHKGIIAYRIETGKMRGNRAAQANRAIDALTRLHKQLREGKTVPEAELHQVIQHSLAIEGYTVPPPEQDSRQDMIMPVRGN